MSKDDPKPEDANTPSSNPENTDRWLSQSLQSLPQVEVPANFLPNVMFKVYEKHSRNLIAIPKFIAFAALLLILSTVCFVWDVYDHMVASGENSFGHAFTQRMDQALSGSQEFLSELGGLLTAAWQITISAINAFFTQTGFFVQALVVLLLVAVVLLLKKGWSRLA